MPSSVSAMKCDLQKCRETVLQSFAKLPVYLFLCFKQAQPELRLSKV